MRRSKEEIEAAKQERLQKAAERAERKAAREKLAAERAKRREEREARKNMTPDELKADRYKRKLEKSGVKKKALEYVNPLYAPYIGDIGVGDEVAARFAGCTIFGKIISITNEDSTVEGEESVEQIVFRKGSKNVKLYTIQGSDKVKYPVVREKIIAKKGE